MGDVTDQQKLQSLIGDQECVCCGISPLSPENADVVDGEVVCIDCVMTYYPEVYRRRVGDDAEASS